MWLKPDFHKILWIVRQSRSSEEFWRRSRQSEQSLCICFYMIVRNHLTQYFMRVLGQALKFMAPKLQLIPRYPPKMGQVGLSQMLQSCERSFHIIVWIVPIVPCSFVLYSIKRGKETILYFLFVNLFCIRSKMVKR